MGPCLGSPPRGRGPGTVSWGRKASWALAGLLLHEACPGAQVGRVSGAAASQSEIGAAAEKGVSSLSLELFEQRLDDLACLDGDLGFVESSL